MTIEIDDHGRTIDVSRITKLSFRTLGGTHPEPIVDVWENAYDFTTFYGAAAVSTVVAALQAQAATR